MKLPDVKGIDFKLPDFPKPVAISIATIAGALLVFGFLLFTLGAAKDEAEADVLRLRADLGAAKSQFNQARDDHDFVIKNLDRYEALMNSDKLIPHTRRTAIREMQSLALEFGLTALNYNFQAAGIQAPEAVAAQPKAGDYRVYVESIELDVGAPLDQNIYSFMAAAYDYFPGALVMGDFVIKRMPEITDEALNKVSRGEDSKIVEGKIKYSWRTAQKEETK